MVESEVEEATLVWLEFLGYRIKSCPDLGPGELTGERIVVGPSEWRLPWMSQDCVWSVSHERANHPESGCQSC
jgi:hypothetical protein